MRLFVSQLQSLLHHSHGCGHVTINRQKATATSNNTNLAVQSNGSSIVSLALTANKKITVSINQLTNGRGGCGRPWQQASVIATLQHINYFKVYNQLAEGDSTSTSTNMAVQSDTCCHCDVATALQHWLLLL